MRPVKMRSKRIMKRQSRRNHHYSVVSKVFKVSRLQETLMMLMKMTTWNSRLNSQRPQSIQR